MIVHRSTCRLSAASTVVVLAMTVGLSAVERGTLAEAKAMLEKAVAHYKTVGRKQALADFSGRKPQFIDRDLYVVCIGPNGIVTAHGGYPAYVGASADILKDAGGKPVGTTIWNTGSSKGSGSSKVEQKNAFFQKVGDDVCAVGAYNPL